MLVMRRPCADIIIIHLLSTIYAQSTLHVSTLHIISSVCVILDTTQPRYLYIFWALESGLYFDAQITKNT